MLVIDVIFQQVMKSRSLCFKSTSLESLSSKVEEQPFTMKNFLNTTSTSGICLGIQLEDLYQYFDVKLNDFKVRVLIHVVVLLCLIYNCIFVIYPSDIRNYSLLLLQITLMKCDQSQMITILEKFSCSTFLAFCVIPDESILNQMEVINIFDTNRLT